MKSLYTIRKIYHYSETVEVEAESEFEAKNIADHTEGDRCFDDHLYDCEVVSREPIEEGKICD